MGDDEGETSTDGAIESYSDPIFDYVPLLDRIAAGIDQFFDTIA